MSRSITFLFTLITLLIANLASAATSTPSKTLRLNKIDPRAINNVTVAVSYYISGHQHYDYETVGSWDKLYSLEIRQTTGTQDSDGIYRGDFLHTTSTGAACTSDCKINILKSDTRTFTDLVVEISFTVGGSSRLHYDWEAAAMPGAPAFIFGEDFIQDLEVDGRSGTWDGSNYRGNLLSTPVQVSSFYWGFNGVGYDSEIWVEGMPPNTSVRVLYESPVFPQQTLYYVSVDANGIGHGVFQTDDCGLFKMRLSDTYTPQLLRVVESSGSTLKDLVINSLRACSYWP